MKTWGPFKQFAPHETLAIGDMVINDITSYWYNFFKMGNFLFLSGGGGGGGGQGFRPY